MFLLLVPARLKTILEGSPQELGILFTAASGVVLLAIWLMPKLRAHPSERRARLHPEHRMLEPAQLDALVGSMTPIVVDLRSPEDFKGKPGRISTATNIPFRQLEGRIEELRKLSENRSVVLVDYSDRLSHQAAALLLERGFPWVHVLKGGMKAWNALRLPVYS